MEKSISRKEVLYVEFTLAEEDEKSRDVSDELRKEFLSDLKKGFNHFWIDLSKLQVARSSLIGTMAFIHENLSDGILVVSGINERMRDIFSVVGFDALPRVKLVENKPS